MQETELRFQSLKDLIYFKQQTSVQELRICTNEKTLTGRFTESEIKEAVKQFKASSFSN